MEAWQARCAQILEEVAPSAPFAPLDADDPWSSPSLDALEQQMLATWASAGDVPADQAAQYEAFLGEGLRRRFGGSWTLLPPSLLGEAAGDAACGLGIASPDGESIDVVSSLVPQAYRAGTGTWWSTCYRAHEEIPGDRAI
ncbi:hypothetical protein BF93_17190 [Brachybacterium phenoliresistens]|uniref:Uncharacterized protein n=2 Tax=Brachybacterium phenoliresistens TaxID=396014 RepID=Z9JUC9_9MICO|nr:hypothetical protein BF93_17190 [Brachybacterium phenoliresistens]